jgi:hypothetical protein
MNPDTSIFPGVSQYSGRHWLKSGMRWLYGVDYIHAWIAFRLGGHTMVYHSTSSGVHLAGYQQTFGTGDRLVRNVYQIDLGSVGHNAFVTHCLDVVPKRYSQRQLFAMAIAKLFRLNRLPFGRNDDEEHVCSETAGRMLFKHTPLTWEGKDFDLYTPRDFVESCEKLVEMQVAQHVPGDFLSTLSSPKE